MTTTKIHVHAENETRVLSITTDDSPAQTARVFAALADETQADVDVDQWVQLQRWLAGAKHRVTIPYARVLAELIPPVAVRLRRDFATLLALIRVHAMLHQVNRDRDEHGQVVATLDDYTVVRALVADILAENVAATVSPAVRETVQTVAKLNCDGTGATATAVAQELQLDKSAAHRRLRSAASGGYLANLEDRRGRPGRWAPDTPLPDDVPLLPPAEQVTARSQRGCSGRATIDEDETAGQLAGDAGGCTVAGESGGKGQRTVAGHGQDDLPSGWVQMPYTLDCVACGQPADTADLRSQARHPGCAGEGP